MNNKPRRPWIAALLTLWIRGLGHLYAGNPKRGIILFGINLFLILVFAVSVDVIAPSIFFLLFAIAVGIAFIVFCISDAIAIAKKKKEIYELAKCNRWFVYAGYIAAVALVNYLYTALLIIPFFIQAYKFPTGSMEPTLLIGDRFIVNKLIYKWTAPAQGDIIVFKYPPDPDVSYVKRLIGAPGDEVEIQDRIVYINGKALKEEYVRHDRPESIYEHFGPVRVPPENYFVMGDNRDNSADSRIWGFVPKENLIGKPLFIYWSLLTPRGGSIILDILPDYCTFLFTKNRWNRMFQVIQ
jgi:signal peptidase I